MLNIENAVIVREINFDRKSPMDLSEFAEFFESHRAKVVGELIKDYQSVGDVYLRSIEESTSPAAAITQGAEEMRPYYYYWERRIFNAITKMIIRALAANKTLWARTEKPSLIKMLSSYNSDMTYHPTVDELRNQLEKFTRGILETTK